MCGITGVVPPSGSALRAALGPEAPDVPACQERGADRAAARQRRDAAEDDPSSDEGAADKPKKKKRKSTEQ